MAEELRGRALIESRFGKLGCGAQRLLLRGVEYEIDGLLQTINKAKDARYENVMGTLLTMYSAANSIFPMRRRAGNEAPGAVDQSVLASAATDSASGRWASEPISASLTC